jgi:hypothetical protein
MVKVPRLFHFTPMLYLPQIMREGINKGEIPVDVTTAYKDVPHAANLTSNGDRDGNRKIWAKGVAVDKSRVRLTVEVPKEALTSFRQIKEKYTIPRRVLDRLCPYEERSKWFYVFGGVKPEQSVKVEIWDKGAYHELSRDEVKDLCNKIDEEIQRALEFKTVTTGRLAGAKAAKVKEGVEDTWLYDGDGDITTDDVE